MNQDGFIKNSFLALVIFSVVIVSAGTGAVLQSQDFLPRLLPASLVQVNDEEQQNEPVEIEQTTPTEDISQYESEGGGNSAPTEIFNLQFPTTPTEDLVPQLIAPEIDYDTPPQEEKQQPSETLIVYNCEYEAEKQAELLQQLSYQKADELFTPYIEEAKRKLLEAQLEQLERLSEPLEGDALYLSPSQQSAIREAAARAVQPTVDYYTAEVLKWEGLLQQGKEEADRLVQQAYNDLLNKCLNEQL